MSPLQSVSPGSPLRVIVADDEALARDCIRLALAGRADVEIVCECEEGADTVAAIRELTPDLVFLDIQMPGVTGFDVVEQIGADRMPPVVFVTAHDVHALRAFRVHALDYVLKPIDDARLHEAVEHAQRQIRLRREGELARRLSAMLVELNTPTAAPSIPSAEQPPSEGARLTPGSRLTVRVDGSLHLVPVADIDWIEGAGNYVKLHVGKRHWSMRTTLVALGARLPPEQFVRIHRSTIVNVGRIREVQPWFGGDYIALLHGDAKLRVSRNYANDLIGPLR